MTPPTMTPTLPRQCALWVQVDARDATIPAGAVEGGLETVAGSPSRQYVCRSMPIGSAYAVPGKWLPGQGCHVAFRSGASVMQSSVLDGMLEILTAAPGCSFSWRTASGSMIPAGAVDLGNPAGGPNYACHGYYTSIASSGTQIGVVIPSETEPVTQQCYFQSFVGATQPQDPAMFEVLAQDTL